MKHYRAYQIIIFSVIMFGCISSALLQRLNGEPTSNNANDSVVISRLKPHFPQASRFQHATAPLPHIKIYNNDPNPARALIGIGFQTKDTAPDIRGYAGPINMAVGIDLEGHIKGIAILRHQETPAYTNALNVFLNQFQGKKLSPSLSLGKDIDAMTRATVTSAAIVRTLSASAPSINQSILQIEQEKTENLDLFNWSQVVMPLILFFLAIKSIRAKSTALRRITQGFSLFYFGYLMATMFSVIHIGNLMILKLPSLSDAPIWYTLTALILITSFLFGNVYCGHICPFAGLQGFCYLLFQGLRNRKVTPSTPKALKARNIKYFVLFISLMLCLFFQTTDVIVFEPFILLFTFHATKIGWTLVGLMLILSIFDYRFWCKYLCPAGAFNNLLARFSQRQIRLQVDVCGATCHRCVNVCPTEAIRADEKNKIAVDFSECILCGNCLRKCAKNTIQYK